jgi:hypothetical protein
MNGVGCCPAIVPLMIVEERRNVVRRENAQRFVQATNFRLGR